MYFCNYTNNRDSQFDFEHQRILMAHLRANGKINGVDTFNGKPCHYVFSGGDIRESLKSSLTNSITRQRCLVKGISQFLFGVPDKTLLQCCAMINKARLTLYTAEGNSVIFNFLKKKIDPSLFFFSEYFGTAHASGDLVNGVRHEDLQSLSFPDNSFDIVLTAEVMEHVPDALAAEKEIVRVLKPRGGYVFTLPYRPNMLNDEIRAVLENGQVKHLLEPQYHGDPVRPEGILVFRVFSENGLRERFEGLGTGFSTYHILDKLAGIIDQNGFVHVVVKH